MPWLNWYGSVCRIDGSGGLSGVVMVRTVVSAQSRPRLPRVGMAACLQVHPD
jgi:hypothetical protein